MNRVGIFWDYENCCSSPGSGYSIAGKIRESVQPLGSISVFNAYMDLSLKSPDAARHYELQASGVTLIHTPHNGKKEAADRVMTVDLLVFALERQGLATIVLITGDGDFSYAVSTLRLRGHIVIFISPPKATHRGLKYLADGNLDWKTDIVECESPAVKTCALISRSPIMAKTFPLSYSRPELPSPWVHESPSFSEASVHTCVEPLELSQVTGMTREGDTVSSFGKHASARMGSSRESEADQRRNVASQATQTYTDDRVLLRPFAPSSDQVSRGIQTLIAGNTLADSTQVRRPSSEDEFRDDENDAEIALLQDAETISLELRESVNTLPVEEYSSSDSMTAVCDTSRITTYINPYLHELCIINIPHNATYQTPPSPGHNIRHSDIRSFMDLIEVLEQEQIRGNLSTSFTSLDSLLLQTNRETYRQAGASGLKEYLELARDANVVSFFDVNWQTEEGRIFLNTGQIGRFRDMGLLEQEPGSESTETTPVMGLDMVLAISPSQMSAIIVPLEPTNSASNAGIAIPINATGPQEEPVKGAAVTKPTGAEKLATQLKRETADSSPVTETDVLQKAVTQLQSGSTKPTLAMAVPILQKPGSQGPTKAVSITDAVMPQNSLPQLQAEPAKPNAVTAQLNTASQKSSTQIGKEPDKSDLITEKAIPQKNPTQLQPESTKSTAVAQPVTPQKPATQIGAQSTKPTPVTKPATLQTPAAQSVTGPAKPVPTTKPVVPQVPATQSVTRPIKPLPTTRPVAAQVLSMQLRLEPKQPAPVVKPTTPPTTSVQAPKAVASAGSSTAQKTTPPPAASESAQSSSSSTSKPINTSQRKAVDPSLVTLVDVMRELRSSGTPTVSRSIFCDMLRKRFPKQYASAKKPGNAVKVALASHVVILSKGSSGKAIDSISLHPDYF